MIYGWRGKIGLIYPAAGVAGDMDFHRMAPEGVAIVTTRMPLEKADAEGLIKMAAEVEKNASLLAQARPDIIIFGCTTGSLVKGIGYDKEIIDRIQNHVHMAAITTSTAVIESFLALKLKKIAVVTPYIDDLNQREKVFIEKSGFQVTAIKGLGVLDANEMQNVRHEQMYRLAKEVFTEDADALFISCTGIAVIDIIEPLEKDLNRPVVTSNQATMWRALRKIGIRETVNRLGKLFQDNT
jgi:maleate isomerase